MVKEKKDLFMMKKWGIKIIPRKVKAQKLKGYTKPAHFEYMNLIAPYEKGSLFVSTPELTKLIRRHRLDRFKNDSRVSNFVVKNSIEKGETTRAFELKHFGSIVFHQDPKNKLLSLNFFYPFGGINSIRHQWFEGKGLASRVELLVAKDLIKRFPGYKVVQTTAPTEKERVRMLERRGMKRGKEYSLKEYYGLVLQDVRAATKKVRKARPKKKVKKPKRRRK